MTVPVLLQTDVIKLLNVARAAWKKLEPGETSAPFTWRGVPYVAVQTDLALKVETPDGVQVTTRYD